MKCLLLIPDFDQSGEVKAWCSEALSLVSISSCKDIPLRELPDCFVLGIPESLLRANTEQDFIYAQYARLKSKRSVLSFSIRGGHDRSGRTVVLTVLQLLSEGESLKFPPEEPESLPKSIGEDERKLIDDRIKAMMQSFQGNSSANVKEMILAVKQNPRIRSFASESTDSLVQKPQWTPRKKKAYREIIGFLIVFALLTILIVEFRSIFAA